MSTGVAGLEPDDPMEEGGFVGLMPNTGPAQGFIKRDEQGFIVTDGALQTSMPGVFAAGDCRAGSTNQVASAADAEAAVALGIRR